MLYVFGGLPATGKSTLSRRLADLLGAVHLRIDSIEQALKDQNAMDPVGIAGYVAAYAVARDNLVLGRTVIADSVNPIEITRAAWRAVATESGSAFREIEVFCSDVAIHRQRYETRVTDIDGLTFDGWQSVLDREYEPVAADVLRIDTATRTIDEAFAQLRSALNVPDAF